MIVSHFYADRIIAKERPVLKNSMSKHRAAQRGCIMDILNLGAQVGKTFRYVLNLPCNFVREFGSQDTSETVESLGVPSARARVPVAWQWSRVRYSGYSYSSHAFLISTSLSLSLHPQTDGPGWVRDIELGA